LILARNTFGDDVAEIDCIFVGQQLGATFPILGGKDDVAVVLFRIATFVVQIELVLRDLLDSDGHSIGKTCYIDFL